MLTKFHLTSFELHRYTVAQLYCYTVVILVLSLQLHSWSLQWRPAHLFSCTSAYIQNYSAVHLLSWNLFSCTVAQTCSAAQWFSCTAGHLLNCTAAHLFSCTVFSWPAAQLLRVVELTSSLCRQSLSSTSAPAHPFHLPPLLPILLSQKFFELLPRSFCEKLLRKNGGLECPFMSFSQTSLFTLAQRKIRLQCLQ